MNKKSGIFLIEEISSLLVVFTQGRGEANSGYFERQHFSVFLRSRRLTRFGKTKVCFQKALLIESYAINAI